METIKMEFTGKELCCLERILDVAIRQQYDYYKEVLKEEIIPKKKKEEDLGKCFVGNSLEIMREVNQMQDLLEQVYQAEEELREK